VLTMLDDDESVFAAMRAGARYRGVRGGTRRTGQIGGSL